MKSTHLYTLCSVALLFFMALGFLVLSPGAKSSVTQLSTQATVDTQESSMSLLPELAESMGAQDANYHIKVVDQSILKANTPSHNSTVVFNSDGVTVSQEEVGELRMTLSGADSVIPVKVSDSKVEYQRGNITEWYINSPLGLEQGFTVNSKPERASDDNSIELRIDLETSEHIQITQSEDRKSIKFVNSEADSVVRYGQLHAFDANGTELGSKMMLTDNGIVLQVSDLNAEYPIIIDPIFETQKIFADDAGNKDHFGRSVHIDGNYAVVGSPYDNIETICTDDIYCLEGLGNRDQGSAYVFKRFGPSDWQQVAKLTADDGESYDYFGYDVGISGHLIIVGAPYDNVDPCDAGPVSADLICDKDFYGNKDQGSAYLFYMNAQGDWNQITKLLASDGYKYDHFGTSVHIDGAIAVVGSPDDNVYAGCDEPGPMPIEGAGVCTDGADGYNKDQGSAYIFTEPSDNSFTTLDVLPPVLFETQKIVAEDGYKYDRFGTSVSIFGTTIVVGAPDDNVEVLCPTGLSCMLGSGGYNKDQGSAYVFDQAILMEMSEVETEDYYIPWVQLQKLVAYDGYKYDHFGTSVDIFGTTIVVGSPDDNVHECEDAGDDNVNTGDLICNLDYGSYTKDQGSAYVFEPALVYTPYLPWVQTQKLIAGDGYKYDHYGFSVAIYLDKILVGSPYDNIHLCKADPLNFLCADSFEGNKDQGSAYLYQFVEDWGYEFVNKLLASDGYSYDRFGKDVDLTESYAISGAPDANLIFNDPERVCDRELTVEEEVENLTETDVENINEDTEENTALGSCGPKDQGAAYIYDIKIIFDGLLPGIDNRINLAQGTNATPNKKVAIIYGFTPGTFIVGGSICNGTVLGINPWKLLGISNANPDGTFSFPVFVPSLDDIQAIYMQAVDLYTCTPSALFYQIIRND